MKRIIITLALVMLMPLAAFAFSDVNLSTDYKDAIDWMYENDVIEGYPDGRFRPDSCVNRAEFLKMTYLVSDFDLGNIRDEIFPDVEPSDWFFPYVMNSYAKGVVEGYLDGTFKPSQCVNRVEAIKMAESLLITQILYPDYDKNTGYSDVNEDAWYYPYMVAALDYDLVGLEHVSDGKFYPNGEMSRKEVAELLFRILQFEDANVGSGNQGQPYLGDLDAPVEIVAYSDYECPFCKRFEQDTFPLIKENYIDTGTVKYVFRDFPLSNIHPNAEDAAVAANCAYVLGGNSVFFDYHRDLFEASSLNEELYYDLADDHDLDGDDFDQCFENYETALDIADDVYEGVREGVVGTPTFFVNGEILNGAQPFEVFESVIESEL